MASAGASARARRAVRTGARSGARELDPAEVAWIAALPCAFLTIAAIVLIGPTLGTALLSPGPEVFFRDIGNVTPQPAEHGRFLLGLIGPPLVAAVVLAQLDLRVRVRMQLRPSTIRALVAVSQIACIAFVALCFAAQNNVLLSADFVAWPHRAYFTPATLAVALLLPPLVLAGLRVRQIDAGRFADLVHETDVRRIACLVVAVLVTAIWMLPAINLDSSIGNTAGGVSGHLLWTMSEPFAVLDGRTPLVDFHAQYGHVWAYLAAAPMALFGATIATYTIVMACASGLAIFAMYAVLRRLTRSSLVALALYLPVLATSFFLIFGPADDRYGPQNLYLLWPVRFAGPWLLVWLAARHVDGSAPRRVWLLFVPAGFVVINNPDFGFAASAATLAALACASPPRSWAATGRLAGEALGGVLAAVAAFAAFTLLRSGSLPDFTLLLEFSKFYGIDGWAQLPMPVLGLHLVVFLTFGAALVVAAVRVATQAGDRLLTSMLAWSGTFGLIATVYWAGRAHTLALFDFFAPWGLALVLLTLVVVRALAARGWRRPTLPELAVLFGFALVVCSLPQIPAPWSQIDRLRDRTPTPAFKQLEGERLVAQTTRPGEKVAILMALGHRVAYDVGVVNVSPYASFESMPTREQLRRTIDVLRREGGRKLYISTRFTTPEKLAMLQREGFSIRDLDASRTYIQLVSR